MNSSSLALTQPTTLAPVTPTKQHFAAALMTMAEERNFIAYHVTIIHKSGNSVRSADWSLQKFLPWFFSQTISHNWLRHRQKFVLFAFLDRAGSRRKGTAQNAYHHHCLLLIDPMMSRGFVRRLMKFVPPIIAPPADTSGYSEFRRYLERQSELLLKKIWFEREGSAVLKFERRDNADLKLNRDRNRNTPVRNVMIQPVREPDQLGYTATYAAKSVDQFLKTHSDSAYQIFPMYSNDNWH